MKMLMATMVLCVFLSAIAVNAQNTMNPFGWFKKPVKEELLAIEDVTFDDAVIEYFRSHFLGCSRLNQDGGGTDLDFCVDQVGGIGSYELNVSGDTGTGIIYNSEILSIAGAGSISTAMSGNTLTITGGDLHNLTDQAVNTTSNVVFATANATRMNVTETLYARVIGIGTVSPTSLLTVAGDLNVSGSNNANVLFVDESAGRVGIGTTTPLVDLQIGSDAVADRTLRLYSDTAGAYYEMANAGNVAFLRSFGSQNMRLDSQGAGGYITFATAGTEIMRINNLGNVGIGTTSPVARLHVNASSTDTSQFRVERAGAGNSAGIEFENGDGNQGTITLGGDEKFGFSTPSTSNAMVILDAGNVGVGTADPSFNLEIINSSAAGSLAVSSAEGSVGDMFLVDESGSVGIGTSTPDGDLQIVSNQGDFRVESATVRARLRVGSGGFIEWLGTTDNPWAIDSQDHMRFNIDTNNDETTKKFVWG